MPFVFTNGHQKVEMLRDNSQMLCDIDLCFAFASNYFVQMNDAV